MPRPSITSPMDNLLLEYAYLKKSCPQILPDFAYILQYQLDRFEDFLFQNGIAKLQRKIYNAVSMDIAPSTQNRIYLITNIDVPELILFNVDESVLNHIERVCYVVSETSDDIIEPQYCNTIFIFRKDSRPFIEDVSNKVFAELIRCFHSESLLSNAGIRYFWSGEPKRKAKSQSHLD